MAGVKAGRVHLWHDNTVWSHVAGDARLLCDGFPYTLTLRYAGHSSPGEHSQQFLIFYALLCSS